MGHPHTTMTTCRFLLVVEVVGSREIRPLQLSITKFRDQLEGYLGVMPLCPVHHEGNPKPNILPNGT